MSHENPLIRQWLQDLGKAVAEAMAGSTEVTSTVHRIQEQGFSLYLVLDAKETEPERPSFDLTSSEVERPSDSRPRTLFGGQAATSSSRAPDRPRFRLDGDDVALLKSLGIDATRTGKRRRS